MENNNSTDPSNMPFKAFYLKNLSSQQISSDILPWEFTPETSIPEGVRKDKKLRDQWINNRETKHYVYTLYEGLNGNIRVSKELPDGEGNPPRYMWGLVADYDFPTDEGEVLKLANTLRFVPMWIEKTLSGNWRFVWPFEQPIVVPSGDWLKHFLKKFEDFGFRISMGAPGFDRGAWEYPSRLFTNSCNWRPCGTTPIPKDVILGWVVKASETFKWDDKNVGVSVPLDVVKAELLKNFPSFVEWPGDFVDGDQGPSFWIEGSTSPKSAIVRPTGMQTFAAHATKSFYTWAELLGIAFVKEYEAAAIGSAVEGIYSDGKNFHRKNPEGFWIPNDKPGIQLHLKISRNVSSKKDKQGKTDIERCLSFIDDHQRVAGAGPFVMRKSGLVEMDGKIFLNTCQNRVIQPAEGKAIYGPNGQFPWMSAWADGYLRPHDPQFYYWISWQSVLYRSVVYSIPQKGPALITAGGAGVGKTFFHTAVIAALIGGHADASDFLAGKESFNSAMLGVPLLTSDDATSATSRQAHRLFTELLKKYTANTRFLHKEKFVRETMVEWLGWLAISCNDDLESLRVIPNLERSILDKLILLHAAPTPAVKFLPPLEMRAMLERELRWWARFLHDWEIPEEIRGDARYVLKPYCEPSLFAVAQQSSETAGFQEILEDFLQDHFKLNPKDTFWRGTAYQLHKAILGDISAEAAMRAYTVDSIGRHLSMLKSKGRHIEAEGGDGNSRVWTFFRDTFAQRKSGVQ